MEKIKEVLNPNQSEDTSRTYNDGSLSGERSHLASAGQGSGGGIGGEGSHLLGSSSEASKGTGISSSIPASGGLPGAFPSTPGESQAQTSGINTGGTGLPSTGNDANTSSSTTGGGIASYIPGVGSSNTQQQSSAGESGGISSYLPGVGSGSSQNAGESGGLSSYLPGTSSAAGGAGSSSYLTSKSGSTENTWEGGSKGISSIIPGLGSSSGSNQDSSAESKGISSYLPGAGGTSNTTSGSTSGGGLMSQVPGVRPNNDRQYSEPGNSAYVEGSYNARTYQLPSRNDLLGSVNKSDTGPHSTETANRLDPRIGAAVGAGAVGAGGTAAAVGAYETSSTTEASKKSEATSERWDASDPVSPSQTRGTVPVENNTSSTKLIPPGDFARDDPVSADDSRSTGYGATAAAVAGGAATAGAAGYGGSELTREDTAEVVGKGDTLKDRTDPTARTDVDQSDIVLHIVKDEKGQERLVMSGPGLDTDPPSQSSVDSSKVEEPSSPKGEKRGSKLKSMLGLSKDKSRSSTDEKSGGSPRQSTATDDSNNNRTAAGGATGGAGAYGTSELTKEDQSTSASAADPSSTASGASGEGFTMRYKTEPGEEQPEWASGEEKDRSGAAEGGEKKSRRLSDLLRRKDPNKLHKDPPETSTAG